MILLLLVTNSVISHYCYERNLARKEETVSFFIFFINETVEKQVEMPPQKKVARKIKHTALQNGFFEVKSWLGNGDIKLGRRAEVMN